jgi:hypothetical protein
MADTNSIFRVLSECFEANAGEKRGLPILYASGSTSWLRGRKKVAKSLGTAQTRPRTVSLNIGNRACYYKADQSCFYSQIVAGFEPFNFDP